MKINWPNGISSKVTVGADWLDEAKKAGIDSPTGCLNGSCGACEIEVNGKVIRACVNTIKDSKKSEHEVKFFYDPFW